MRRTKTVEISPDGPDAFTFSARLIDQGWGGKFGGEETVVVHDIILDGHLAGAELNLTDLVVTPVFLPYTQCPRIEAACQRLVGHSLRSGWRQAVLANLGGSRGCTHVTTLLLGMSEVTTQVIFLQMNETTEYTPSSRTDGRWMTTGLEVAPGLVDACHSLTHNGDVLGPILGRSMLVNESVDSGDCES